MNKLEHIANKWTLKIHDEKISSKMQEDFNKALFEILWDESQEY